jgi:hypothetical protein
MAEVTTKEQHSLRFPLWLPFGPINPSIREIQHNSKKRGALACTWRTLPHY